MQLSIRAALAAVFLMATAGTALAATQTFEVEPFTGIVISSGIDATVTVGGPQSVVADSPHQEELEELIVEVKDGRLRAYTDWNLFDLFNWGATDRQIRITISVPALTAAEANSGADVEVTGMSGDDLRLHSTSGADLVARNLAGRSYNLNASSGSDLTVEGTCDSATVNASSGSDLRAEKLLCADVEANVSSGASADVRASASLKANASSGATLNVYGNPPRKAHESSSGGDVNLRD